MKLGCCYSWLSYSIASHSKFQLFQRGQTPQNDIHKNKAKENQWPTTCSNLHMQNQNPFYAFPNFPLVSTILQESNPSIHHFDLTQSHYIYIYIQQPFIPQLSSIVNSQQTNFNSTTFTCAQVYMNLGYVHSHFFFSVLNCL